MPATLRPRRVPERTCVGCRQTAGKRTMLRIVRAPEGHLRVDPTGKANGRGAYLHEARECWEKALKGGRMERALRMTPAPEDLDALRAFGSTLPEKGDDER